MRRIHRGILFTAILILSITLVLLIISAQTVVSDDFQTKLDAAHIMQACMDQIKQYKAEMGIQIAEEDIHQTGLIGDEFTSITTTVGVLEAKRTTANADMAAVAVQMLTEAGIKRGDTVGAAFSGSFPGMNLAFLSAAEAMGLDLVYTASVGASMYGANQQALTFPDMLQHLIQNGILSQYPAALSLGGDGDCGLNMDPDAAMEIRKRLEGYGYPFIYIENYKENINERLTIYDQYDIRCFVGVGGNVTTTGEGENDLPYGVVLPKEPYVIDSESGLLEHYLARGLPVIHVLNMKELVAQYGLAYDPQILPEQGTSAIYMHTQYRWPIGIAGVLITIAILIIGRMHHKNTERKT